MTASTSTGARRNATLRPPASTSTSAYSAHGGLRTSPVKRECLKGKPALTELLQPVQPADAIGDHSSGAGDQATARHKDVDKVRAQLDDGFARDPQRIA